MSVKPRYPPFEGQTLTPEEWRKIEKTIKREYFFSRQPGEKGIIDCCIQKPGSGKTITFKINYNK